MGRVAEVASAYYGQFLPMARTAPAQEHQDHAGAGRMRRWGSSAIPLRIGCECPNNGLSLIRRQGSENFTHIVTSGLGCPSGTDAS